MHPWQHPASSTACNNQSFHTDLRKNHAFLWVTKNPLLFMNVSSSQRNLVPSVYFLKCLCKFSPVKKTWKLFKSFLVIISSVFDIREVPSWDFRLLYWFFFFCRVAFWPLAAFCSKEFSHWKMIIFVNKQLSEMLQDRISSSALQIHAVHGLLYGLQSDMALILFQFILEMFFGSTLTTWVDVTRGISSTFSHGS